MRRAVSPQAEIPQHPLGTLPPTTCTLKLDTHRCPSWQCTELQHPGWGQSLGSRAQSPGTWHPVEGRAEEGELLALGLSQVPSPRLRPDT